MATESNQLRQLPDALRQQFQAAQRRLWQVDTVVAVCGLGSGLIVSYVLQFLFDRLWDTPTWLRVAISGFGVAVSAYFVYGWLNHWVWHRPDLSAMAKLVQRRYRRLGDRLLGIVELADERTRPPNVSAELCRAAIHQVADEAVRFDFRAAVATRKPRILFITLVLLAGLVTAPWIFVPQASANALSRWLRPGAAVARYTFVSLSDLPATMVVPHGEPFEISCAIQPGSFWHPTHASCRYDRQPSIVAPIHGAQVVFTVPGQTQPGTLALRVGDVLRQIAVTPTHRPGLKQLLAQVRLPEYLQSPPLTADVQNATLAILTGSRVTFTGTTTRPLREASVEAGRREPLTVTTSGFRSAELNLDGQSRCTFTWLDTLGLAGAAPWVLTVQTSEDQPPRVECKELPAVVAILEDEVLEITVAAQDDFGVRDIGIAWQAQTAQDAATVVAQHEATLKTGGPQARTLEGTYRLAPAEAHVPADTVITLRAVATDYQPGRAPTQSAVHRIHVLSREEQARMLQERLDQVFAQLEEVTRKEEALREEAKKVREQSPDKLAAEPAAKQLAEQAREQQELAEKLKKLAEQGRELLREALRNPTLKEEQLRDWAKALEAMHDLAQQQMPEAAQSLKSSEQNGDKRAEKLDRALELQKEILQALQQLQKTMQKDLDKLQANTLAQRFRTVAKTESGIREVLQRMLPDTVGLDPKDLKDPQRSLTTNLAAGQERTGKDSQQLQEETRRFFDRTHRENYGAVAKEMEEMQSTEELGRIAGLIRQNVAVQAIQRSGQWSEQFNEWANKLEAANKPPGDGNSAAVEPNEEALKRLMALLRLRIEEENLRDRTNALDEQKANDLKYNESAKRLADRQQELMEDANKLQPPGGNEMLGLVHEAMGDAAKFLKKPETDHPTIAAETDAMNLLDAMINSAGGGAPSPGQQSGLGFLAQMMSMSGGARGGGSLSGGTTDRTNKPTTGDARGKAADPRTVTKASGGDPKTFPSEFRQALQGYYQSLSEKSP